MEISQELTVGAQQARADLRSLIDAALEQSRPTVIHRNGRPVAVLVPYPWYIEQTQESNRDADEGYLVDAVDEANAGRS